MTETFNPATMNPASIILKENLIDTNNNDYFNYIIIIILIIFIIIIFHTYFNNRKINKN